MSALSEIVDILERSGVDYAVIGAHAVNVWLEPRFTADVDVTLAVDRQGLRHLIKAFQERGYRVAREHGAAQPSGPDFVRLESEVR